MNYDWLVENGQSKAQELLDKTVRETGKTL